MVRAEQWGLLNFLMEIYRGFGRLGNREGGVVFFHFPAKCQSILVCVVFEV